MEFYKLWHRKAFMIGSIFTILTMLFYFQVVIAGGEISTVNGVKYYGKEAVKVNRRITESYRGTDRSKGGADHSRVWLSFCG